MAKKKTDQYYYGTPSFEKPLGQTIINTDFSAWLINNGILQNNSSAAQNGSTILYTCPTGKVFYVISASLQIITSATTNASATLNLNSSTNLIQLRGSNLVGVTDYFALPMSMVVPLKIEAGETIEVFSGNASVIAVGSFFGYEIDVSKLKELKKQYSW